jgi:uncharacterized protein (TIRG00374 family)
MNKRLVFFIKLGISICLLLFLFHIIPARDMYQSMRKAQPAWVLLGMATAIPIILLSAFQVQYLTRIQGMAISLVGLIRINMATAFYALFLPGILAGGAVKWLKFVQHEGKPIEAFVVVFFNRFVETVFIVMVGILFATPEILSSGLRSAVLLWCLIFIGLAAGYVLSLQPFFIGIMKGLTKRCPLPLFLKDRIDKIINSLGRFQALKAVNHLKIFLILALKNASGILSYYFLARSLSVQVSFYELAWIRSIILLLIILPISISGLGIREGSLVILLARYGIPAHEALAFSFLVFFRNSIQSLAGGFWELQALFSQKGTSPDHVPASTKAGGRNSDYGKPSP